VYPITTGKSGLGVVFGRTKPVCDTSALLDIMQSPSHECELELESPKKSYVDELTAPLSQLRITYTKIIRSYEKSSKEAAQNVDDILQILKQEGHIINQFHTEIDYEKFLDPLLKVKSVNLALAITNIPHITEQKADLSDLQSSTLAMFEYDQSIPVRTLLDATNYFYELSDCVDHFFYGKELLIEIGSSTALRQIGEFNANSYNPIEIEYWYQSIYNYDRYYPLYNSSGHPAISLSIAQNSNDLPICIQFATAKSNEALLFSIAKYFEQVRPWTARVAEDHVKNTADTT
jgi:amidase